MDPAEDRRETKRQKEHMNMLAYVADSEHGIPRRCACGSGIIDEVRRKEDYDTVPGKRFFTCRNYKEEIECLRKHVEEAEKVIKDVPILELQIQTLEAQVKTLNELMDSITVQVTVLENMCFE